MPVKFEDFIVGVISNGNAGFEYDSSTNAQNLLIEFNHRISELIATHGIEPIGKAIWFLYGCASNTTHDALDSSADDGLTEFYTSLTQLYDDGFARHCENSAGHSDRNSNSFATACYMLWDMDSGLEYQTFRGRPELFRFGEQLIDFGLAHRHAACQESFLHCLGHLHFDRALFVEDKISQFLRRGDLSSEIREYAKQCQAGVIM